MSKLARVTNKEPSHRMIKMTCSRSQNMLHGRAGPKNLGDLRPMLILYSLWNTSPATSFLHPPCLHCLLFLHLPLLTSFFPISFPPTFHLCLLLSWPASRPPFFLHLYFSFGLISLLPGEALLFSRAAPLNLPEAYRSNKATSLWCSGMWDACLAASPRQRDIGLRP